jgi:hypothetical protein
MFPTSDPIVLRQCADLLLVYAAFANIRSPRLARRLVERAAELIHEAARLFRQGTRCRGD